MECKVHRRILQKLPLTHPFRGTVRCIPIGPYKSWEARCLGLSGTTGPPTQRPCEFRDFLEAVRVLRPGKKLYVVINDFSVRLRAPSRWTDLFTETMRTTRRHRSYTLAKSRADLKTNCSTPTILDRAAALLGPGFLTCHLVVRLLGDPSRDLGPGGESEFGQDVLHMALCRARGDHQATGDGLIRQAFADQVGDLAFPLGQSR